MSRTITVEHNGTTYSGRIGRIQKTFLGKEDHGIFTASVGIAGPGWGQSIPTRGLGLGSNSGYGLDFIWQVTSTVGAPSWEDLRSREVIALYEQGRESVLIVGLAHISDESKVLIFEDHANEWRAKESQQA